MKNCGRRFHNEVGKFRFLNELIKVVSPKVGDRFFLSHVCFPGPFSLNNPAGSSPRPWLQHGRESNTVA